jgi:hypothetical protein
MVRTAIREHSRAHVDPHGRTLIRKTSFASRSLRRRGGQASPTSSMADGLHRRHACRNAQDVHTTFAVSRTSARNDLLFTMSDNTRGHTLLGRSAIAHANSFFFTDEPCSGPPPPFGLRRDRLRCHLASQAGAAERRRLVEPDGIEPTTSCLQSRRSPN